MPYSVMIWLVEPSTPPHSTADDPGDSPPARGSSGVTAPPPATHLSYGLFENERERREALSGLSGRLAANEPIRVARGRRTFLIPHSRVHYVVSEKVTLPREGNGLSQRDDDRPRPDPD